MKRTMSAMLVLGLLAAGLSARAAQAQEPYGPADDPELTADLGDVDHGPLMAPDDRGGGGMGERGRGAWMGRGGGHGRFGPMLASELDLTPEQIQKMQASSEAQQRKAIQTRADIQIARLDLRKMMQADKPDAKAIEAQIDRIAGLRAGLEKSRVNAMLEFRATLTPDQQKKLRDLRERGPSMRNPGGTQKKSGNM